MKTIQELGLLPIWVFLALISVTWPSQSIRADEVFPGIQQPNKQEMMSTTLKATIKNHQPATAYPPQAARKSTRNNVARVKDWDQLLKKIRNPDSQEAKMAATEAAFLALTMVVISYNPPPPPVISATSATKTQIWQWTASCWSNPSMPSLPPPPPGGSTINSVPEPTTLVSGLIGLSIMGFTYWRRKRSR